MTWTTVLDYLDKYGYEFSLNPEKNELIIYRGNRKIAILNKGRNWVLTNYKTSWQVAVKSSPNPIQLLTEVY